jgi:hypothetical protein
VLALTTLGTKAVGDKITAAWANDIKANVDFFTEPPGCQVYRSAALNISNNTATTLSWDAETYDTDSMHSTSVNPTRITFNTGGTYLLNVYVGSASATYTEYAVQVLLNGAPSVRNIDFINPTWPGARYVVIRSFSAGDYIEIVFEQSSGGTRALATGNNVSGVTAQWVSS